MCFEAVMGSLKCKRILQNFAVVSFFLIPICLMSDTHEVNESMFLNLILLGSFNENSEYALYFTIISYTLSHWINRKTLHPSL